MAYETIIVEKENGIAIVTLNRPDRLNATTTLMGEETKEAYEDIANDDDIRVLIITGAGRGFCAGADRDAQAERRDMRVVGQRVERDRQITSRGSYIYTMEKPTIAAVNGPAAGSGFSLALSCDIRIASEKAVFGSRWARRGLMPDAGATYFLPRLVGPSKALEIFWSDDLIDAQEAYRIGLVNRVVPHEQLMPVTKELAAKIGKGPSIPYKLTKVAVHKVLDGTFQSAMDFERLGQSVCYGTEDHREGLEAAKERREPVFKGR